MMNGNIDWMQQLGYAFADQQAAVMDSVQRLRRQAQGSGSLKTTPEQVVRAEQQYIYIEPAQPNVVYVPNYNPSVVYGSSPYPAYPPVYVSPYPLGGALAAGIAFGVGVGIVGGLWGWASPGWGYGNVNVNVNRYNNINTNNIRNNRASAIRSGNWQPNRQGGRPAGLARPPGGPVGGPARPSNLPANSGPLPYNGYYFRILKGEGVNSADGAKSFVIKGGRRTEGFALIAWPSSYNSSGIMTFEVGPDGIVFQKDLGPGTAREVPGITQFDPDLTWMRVDVTNQ